MNSSSTLVATVSINYEDFTEGFLTCGTCLLAYDQSEHTPKLLSCSHTICQSCLELIATTPSLNNNTEQGCIRCPICRQNITIPNGGIGALPPSFLVNQLFDLVNKKPREFIPKCSVHNERELLFCEICDCVFCDTCDIEAGPAKHTNETCTVIPFSTAIKRMSEILNYRSQQCSSKLDEARDNVQKEIEKLSAKCEDATGEITLAFQEITSIVEARTNHLLNEVKQLHEYKKNVLLQQLRAIEIEKSTLCLTNSVKINNEADVKNLSKKISDLSDKNETAITLFTPRENCFICFEDKKDDISGITELIKKYGNIRTSKTYPPFCTSSMVHYSTHLRSLAIVQSVDYDGCNQKFGGDPIHAELSLVGCAGPIDSDMSIRDKRDGTYEVEFTPPFPGKYQLFIYIFHRPIKNCPLEFTTSIHQGPVAVFGGKNRALDAFEQFNQPASLAINKNDGRVFVLDSFNSRIKVLAQIDCKESPFSYMNHIEPGFLTRCCTCLALFYPEEDTGKVDSIQKLGLSPTKPAPPTLLVSDWRSRKVFEINLDGKLLKEFEHEDLQEPTTIAIDSRRRIFVVDKNTIFVFSATGKLLFRLSGCKNDFANQDSSSIKKMDPFDSTTLAGVDIEKSENGNLMLTNSSETIKDLKINSNDCVMPEKHISKSGTLSSLLSKRRRPKMNPGASLQRGSKAVISAASRIRSTFTLSHSSSLVSAVSLQSMFNSSKQHHSNNNNNSTTNNMSSNTNLFVNNQQQQYDTQSVGVGATGVDVMYHSSTLARGNNINNNINDNNKRHNRHSYTINELVESTTTDDAAAAVFVAAAIVEEEAIEPFGIIRGITIGPNDELVVACESSIRILEPGDEFIYKRGISQSRAGNQARLCGMTYDTENDLLLCLYTDRSRSFIEIFDYFTGKSKFIIDSYDSKLIRPSSIAVYGRHVVVTDLGNDCIKKYTIY